MSILDDTNSDTEENLPTPNTTGNVGKTQFADIVEKSYVNYSDQYNPLLKKYIYDMYHDKTYKEFVHKCHSYRKTYDSRVDIDSSDFIIKNKRYHGTQGVNEWLFENKL